MNPVLIFILAAMPFAATAQTFAVVQADPAPAAEAPAIAAPAAPELSVIDAADIALSDLVWQKRPVVVFANTPDDPAFALQMRLLLERPEPLIERDVVVITDTSPGTLSDARHKLRPRGFSLVLIDKDGAVNLRKPLPWDVREITRAIDKMPIRREEVQQGRVSGR